MAQKINQKQLNPSSVDAVIEWGEDATSTWRKYESGRLEMTVIRTFTGTVSNSWQNMRISTLIGTASYPVALTRLNTFQNTVTCDTDSNTWVMSAAAPTLSDTGSCYIVSPENITASRTYRIRTFIVGKWN